MNSKPKSTPPSIDPSLSMSGRTEPCENELGDVGDENSKTDITSHALYPLLRTLFMKCESGTQDIDKVTSTDEFNKEVETFINQIKDKPNVNMILNQTKDIDNLMIKAVQVLRIHLLELEKVNELCVDFCSRYINCIKTKLNSREMLKGDDSESDEDDDFLPVNLDSANTQITTVPSTESSITTVHTDDHSSVTDNTPIPITTTPRTLAVKGTTPFSQIGSGFPRKIEDDKMSSLPKRGILPKNATQIMKSWLFQHIMHPYPTEEEKRQISDQTNLSLLQVNNWFINARRRILQPMLESNGAALSYTDKTNKKNRNQIKHASRFWPMVNSKIDGSGTGDSQSQDENQTMDQSADNQEPLGDINVDSIDEDDDPSLSHDCWSHPLPREDNS